MTQKRPPLGPVLVIIPTYNEAENTPLITARLRKAVPAAHILIVDDNSPDGTGAIADQLAEKDGHIHVLHRKGKEGLAAAYVAGFHWGLDNGFDVLVEHDADGSHQPEQLPLLLDALTDADAVKGSRWVKGGSVVNWPLSRKILSVGGNAWTKLMLGIPVNDATGGFCAWRANTLRNIGIDELQAAGYGFQVDLAWRAIKNGFEIKEVPIEFVERELGSSKMSQKIVLEALALTTRWGVEYRLDQVRDFLGRFGKQASHTATEVGIKAAEFAGDVAEQAGKVAEQAGKAADEARIRLAARKQTGAAATAGSPDEDDPDRGPTTDYEAKSTASDD